MTSLSLVPVPPKAARSRSKSIAPPAEAPAPRVPSRAVKIRLRRQAMAAGAIGIVAAVLTGLSLSHLAHGIHIVTGCDPREAWAFAVGIDVAMIAAEVSLLFAATPGVAKVISVYATPLILGTSASSAVLNAFAFVQGAGGDRVLQGTAVAFGVAIPAMIYALTRIGAALYLNGDR